MGANKGPLRYRDEDAVAVFECALGLQCWLLCLFPKSLLLSALLIGQQWALSLQMAPQSAVYLASPNLWVYAN